MMQEEKKTQKRPHNVIMENRRNLIFSGVLDVDSFDEQSIIVYTELGELTVRGTGLHISNLNTDTGELTMTGQVQGMVYTDEREKSGGLLGRLFR